MVVIATGGVKTKATKKFPFEKGLTAGTTVQQKEWYLKPTISSLLTRDDKKGLSK